jgi:hypothetical protein
MSEKDWSNTYEVIATIFGAMNTKIEKVIEKLAGGWAFPKPSGAKG